jgi:hypothetical protein
MPRAGIGEHDAAAIALKQRLTQFEFQLPHLPAERGLHHREERRGPREAAELGHMPKVFQLFQFHSEAGVMRIGYNRYMSHSLIVYVIVQFG